jgi:restriction endonuclease Mrr
MTQTQMPRRISPLLVVFLVTSGIAFEWLRSQLAEVTSANLIIDAVMAMIAGGIVAGMIHAVRKWMRQTAVMTAARDREIWEQRRTRQDAIAQERAREEAERVRREAAAEAERQRRQEEVDRLQRQAEAERKRRLATLGGWMGLTPAEFEAECARLLRTAGYDQVTVTQASGDGGVDVIATIGQKRYAAQCKKYRGVVDPVDVRALAGVVAVAGYAGGILMTTGDLTQASREFAKQAGLRIYTGADLVDLALRCAS